MSDVTLTVEGLKPGQMPVFVIRVESGPKMSDHAKAIMRALYGAEVDSNLKEPIK